MSALLQLRLRTVLGATVPDGSPAVAAPIALPGIGQGDGLVAARPLHHDGGTGLQDAELTAEDFGGAELDGCNENLVFTRPDVVREVHRRYLDAGADLCVIGDVDVDREGVDPVLVRDLRGDFTARVARRNHHGRAVARHRLKELDEDLKRVIFGQDEAIGALASAIKMTRAGLGEEEKPIGSFLFAGPTGVGKTETALALAEVLYGGEQNMTTINMSEFKEEHKVSLLMGSPPGYVGYDEGGVLTEAVQFRAFGWTMPLTLDLAPQLLNLGLGLLAAALAALYPAWSASRSDPAPHLRED